jgi:uncharacterized protein YaeQ
MALTATLYRLQLELSDVDRGVYESLDLRLARHPSESARYMLSRLIGYCLEYEAGIAFSKGGLSERDEPPVSVRDPTSNSLRVWIDVGSPSAERLHKATKAAERVVLYTHVDPVLLRREAATRAIHRVEQIEVWRLESRLLDALEPQLERTTKLELVRSDGQLYFTAAGVSTSGALERLSLVGESP